MALSKVDRSLLRSYPELRELIEGKKLSDIDQDASSEFGTEGFNSLDDPTTIQQRTSLDG